MELRHIRYFLAVAEERNFTRAAARLGIGQPPLSQQIKDLEREVGVPLFHRVPHGAELTDAGHAFREKVHTLPAQANNAMHVAQRVARGETGQLSLGFTGTAALNPVFPELIRRFRKRFPDVEITLEEANSIALLSGLESNRLDVAIIRPAISTPRQFSLHRLNEEEIVAALPLAYAQDTNKDNIELASLSSQPLILTPRELGAGLYNAALQACRKAGFEPIIGQPAPQIASILSLVSAELGFSLVPASTRQLQVQGVVFRRIDTLTPTVALGVATMRAGASPIALNFSAMARLIAKEQ
ncbi:LysR family transcriptional regulator [Oceanimonas doudoroffii]|uniref:Transcriptional regulator n=1 Tax=Oceanimonas doudoroffii TaxID=84158 RepID=A0A233RG62_9GAMM|nr:LysR family transcriptional regulator [Oceanimonas doudoroffii]OXY82381.1 transcriptional regulator [Oceanimonas doudoroffii]